MLLDDNLIFCENKTATAAVTSDPVALTGLTKPGSHQEPIFLYSRVNTAFAGGTSVTFKLTQSDTEDGSYEDVPGSSNTMTAADLTAGAEFLPRILPKGVTKPWIKLVTAVTGTFTAGTITAAVVREDPQPYVPGLYIDKGVVQG